MSVMIHDFVSQYCIWTFTNALYMAPHTYMEFFTPIPSIWVLAMFSRDLPKSWSILIALFMLVFFLVPVARYLLPILPFVCLLAVDGYYRLEKNIISFFIVGALFASVLGHVAADIYRPWRTNHPYNVMDIRYLEETIKKQEHIIPPIWTNYYQLYWQMGWPVPTFDLFNAAEVPGPPIDWTKPPFSKIQTRIELLPTNTPMGREQTEIKGWKTALVPLTRGQFTMMRIRRKK